MEVRTLVVGAGPAGLTAAGTAGDGVVLLEGNEKAGKKLYITGKGRCNVTHDCAPREFLESVVSNPKFLYSAVAAFPPEATVRLLDAYGTPTKRERGGRIFPVSDKASDVTAALTRYAAACGAEVRYRERVKRILPLGNGFRVETEEESYRCRNVVLACGGKSYSSTGSDGSGYGFAAELGHTVVEPVPALVPLLLEEDVTPLKGLSLKNVTATVSDGKFVRTLFGEMLFTESGVSGPIILSLSSLINRLPPARLPLSIDLKPALGVEELDRRIVSDLSRYSNKQLRNALVDLMPHALIPFVLRAARADGTTAAHSVGRETRSALVRSVKALPFSIAGLDDIERGIVTAGGVSVSEVSPKTMESKLRRGLFFAGEMLDLDAFTGGYNIQIALSTGYAAGMGARE